MEVNDVIFRFQFRSKAANASYLTYTVYSYKREDMLLFLKQHNFDLNHVHVDILEIAGEDFNENDILQPYLFGTNSSEDVYTIMSTISIVDDCILNTAQTLANTLLFGPPIIRTDIELFRVINDLINELPHVYILDHTLIDETNDSMYSPDHSKYIKSWDGETPDPGDDVYVIESLYNCSILQEIQPITMEGYVSNFTSMMVDEYN